jgi:transposase
MAKAISNEKRADIIRHIEAGEKRAEIAKWLCVCVHTVCRVWRKYKRSGSYAPEPQNTGRKPLVSEDTMERVANKVMESPDMTLAELIEEFSLPISQVALSKRLINLGFRYKKNSSSELPRKGGRCQSKECLAIAPKRDERGKHLLVGRDPCELRHDASVRTCAISPALLSGNP